MNPVPLLSSSESGDSEIPCLPVLLVGTPQCLENGEFKSGQLLLLQLRHITSQNRIASGIKNHAGDTHSMAWKGKIFMKYDEGNEG